MLSGQRMAIMTLNQLQATTYTNLLSHGNSILYILKNKFDSFTSELENRCNDIRDNCFTVQ